MFIEGITVQLEVRVRTGEDEFRRPVYAKAWTDVDNVLVAPASTADDAASENLTGKTAEYQLCIPKGDAHNWVNTRVRFFGETWRTVGYPEEYIEAMVPLSWNRKVKVERDEQVRKDDDRA